MLAKLFILMHSDQQKIYERSVTSKGDDYTA